MRLPIVARTPRQQRIECLLPGGVRLNAEVLAVRRAEPTQRVDQLLALSGLAHIAHGEHDDLFPVDVHGQEWQWGCLPGDHPDVDIVRHRLGETGKPREHGLCLVKRKGDQPAQHVRPHAMELELEAGDDTEVPSATTQPPEQVSVLCLAGVHLGAVCRDNFGGQQVVDSHAVLPAQPAKAAAERQACHARGRVDAKGRREPVRLSGRVKVGERASGLDGRPAGARVDLDALHQRQVDHQAVIADGIARDVVPAPSDRDEQTILAPELDGLDDIFRRRAAGDKRGPAVNSGVPDLANLVVARVAR